MRLASSVVAPADWSAPMTAAASVLIEPFPRERGMCGRLIVCHARPAPKEPNSEGTYRRSRSPFGSNRWLAVASSRSEPCLGPVRELGSSGAFPFTVGFL